MRGDSMNAPVATEAYDAQGECGDGEEESDTIDEQQPFHSDENEARSKVTKEEVREGRRAKQNSETATFSARDGVERERSAELVATTGARRA
jgi:hypothetical protein